MSGMTRDQFKNELLDHLPDLGILLAGKLVDRAWRRIRDARQWGFLMAYGTYYAPPAISNTGTLTVTQFSQTVTLNAAASAAVTGLSTPLITKRQLRISGGPYYSIQDADYSVPAAVVLTLDRQYMETSGVQSTWSIFRAFYNQPLDALNAEVTDFLKLRTVYDTQNAYCLSLHGTAEEVASADPQRASLGQPYNIYSRAYDSSNNPVYEFWPGPNAENTYLVCYQRRGDAQAATGTLPDVISDDLILEAALVEACKWSLKQKPPAGMLMTEWTRAMMAAMKEHRADYQDLLYQSMRADEETFVQGMIYDQANAGLSSFPGDSSFLQSHGI